MRHWMAISLLSITGCFAAGCGSSTTATTSPSPKSKGNFPAEAMVTEFLDAVRTGNDDKAARC